MKDISFTVWKDPATQELPQTYYFDLDADGDPVKLGDGSFGIVYRVRMAKDSKVDGDYAVKIFYLGEDIEDRFWLELNFMENIRKKAAEKNIHRGELIGVLEPRGGTAKFRESDAYHELFAKKFPDLKISSHAIVMERYDGTLKDLLENKVLSAEYSGYEMLRQIPVNERIKWILPFIEASIAGLRTLYIGSNAHLDQKPANMFYRKKGADFEVVIGDMGYLNPENDRSLEIKTIDPLDEFRRRPLLGTLHYRSPEQKDNYEICDAAVRKIEGEEHLFELIIQDPKFNDSIIEKEDFVYFSKSQEKHPYFIATIEPSEKTGHKFTRIVIKDNEEGGRIREDAKTQIVIRKRQRLRTDLFGIGAIAYDLLTCGKSPERFYERIRIWDNRHTSITEIMERYRRVASFNSSEPQSQHIFESLNFGTQYANGVMVQFILRCMLYNSPGTFFNSVAEKAAANGGVPAKSEKGENSRDREILAELRDEFVKEFREYLREDRRMDNPIVFRVKPPTVTDPNEPLKLSTLLDSIQKSDLNHFVERYMLGAHYVQQILDYISAIFDIKPPFYFSEFNPENIVESRSSRDARNHRINLNTPYVAFSDEDDYLKTLQDYKLHIKLKTYPNSFFIPDYLVHVHRPIQLTAEQDNPVANRFSFCFVSKSYPYDEVKRGDWILARKKDNNKNELYKIVAVDKHKQTLDVRFFDIKTKDFIENKTLTGIADLEEKDPFVYFKELDRKEYYLQILGIYIHQFFFAGLNGASMNSLPAFVEMRNIESFLHPKDYFSCKDAGEFVAAYNQASATQREVVRVMTKLVNLYTRLIFTQLDNSYYKKGDQDAKPISDVIAEIKVTFADIRSDIEKMLRVFPTFLERVQHLEPMLKKSIQNEPLEVHTELQRDLDTIKAANERIAADFPTDFEFEEVLKNLFVHRPWKPHITINPVEPPPAPEPEPESSFIDSIFGKVLGNKSKKQPEK